MLSKTHFLQVRFSVSQLFQSVKSVCLKSSFSLFNPSPDLATPGADDPLLLPNAGGHDLQHLAVWGCRGWGSYWVGQHSWSSWLGPHHHCILLTLSSLYDLGMLEDIIYPEWMKLSILTLPSSATQVLSVWLEEDSHDGGWRRMSLGWGWISGRWNFYWPSPQ